MRITRIRYLNNPLNAYFSLGVVAQRGETQPAGTPRTTGRMWDAGAVKPGASRRCCVLVVGETARADHFALNGYATADHARARRAGRAELSRRRAPAAPTPMASLPCMFSSLGKRGLRRAQASSTRTCSTSCSAPAWRCCGSTTRPAARACATACRMRPRADAGRHAGGAALCDDGECLDEALLRRAGRADRRAAGRAPRARRACWSCTRWAATARRTAGARRRRTSASSRNARATTLQRLRAAPS